MEYKDWRNFLKVLDKAKVACENSEFNVNEQLVEVNKLSKRNNNATITIQDYKLSRYICYLIVQNADPNKKVVAIADMGGMMPEDMPTPKKSLKELERDKKRIENKELSNKENKKIGDKNGK